MQDKEIEESLSFKSNGISTSTQVGDLAPSGLSTAQLENEIISILQRRSAPAIAVTIQSAKGNQTIVKGIRKQGQISPVTENDSFMAGPVSSTLVPIILSRLIERKYFTWSSTLPLILPDLHDSIHPSHHDTTIEMFSAHISGITTKFPDLEEGKLSEKLTSADISGYEGRRRTLLSTLKNPPERKPGPGSSYRNAVNLLILAFIVETVTKETWEAIVQKEVFDPIGMKHSGIGQPDGIIDEDNKRPAQPWPHEILGNNETPVPLNTARRAPWLTCSATYPSLGVYSTLADLSTYLRFCLLEEKGSPLAGVINEDDRGRLQTLAIGGDYTPGGFDIIHPAWAQGTVLKCQGHVSGFSTGVWIAPKLRYAFIVIVNLDGPAGAAVRDEVYKLIAGI
jgi:CubicO group peptidase (beta-lactamase class C family)